MPDERDVIDILERLDGLSMAEHVVAERQTIAALERLMYSHRAGARLSRAERPEYATFIDLLIDLQDSHAESLARLNMATIA